MEQQDIIAKLTAHYKKEPKWGCDSQITLIQQFLIQYATSYEFPDSAQPLLQIMQTIPDFPSLKPLQVIRVLTRSKNLHSTLTAQFLQKLNQAVGELLDAPFVLVEVLTLHLRYIEARQEIVTDVMLGRVLDVLAAATNPQVIKIVIEILKEMASKGRTKVLEEIWYVGRMLFALDRLDGVIKVRLVNLLAILLGADTFNENFRRIHGVSTLIAQLKKAQNNLVLKVSILNCIHQLLSRTQAVYDFKVHGILSMLQAMMQRSANYIEISLIVKISSILIFDDDLNIKFLENGLGHVIRLLIKSHVSNIHLLKFDDVQQCHQKEAVAELKLLLFRLLRFIFSIDKNRRIFKKIFPSQLLGPFIDIGNFVKPTQKYRQVSAVYDELTADQVVNILDQYEKVEADQQTKRQKRIDTLGSYTLIESIGQGAFGTVFLVKKGENKYALKRIQLQNQVAEAKKLEDHFKEVKIYSQLKHPNIVNYYESFVDKGYLCIVMEFIEGFNLSELLRIQNQKKVPFEEKQIWKIVIHLLSVLKYLHKDKSVLHRDLNPANIMVDNNFNIKLADFGLAKVITQAQQMTTSFVGTLIYSCPEIVSNKAYSEKADIWSFGCVVYELMKLKPPFTGNNPLMLAKNIVDTQYESLPETYSETLRDLVTQALEKDQRKRPDVLILLRMAVQKVISYTDELKQKQVILNDQILFLTKKLNQRKPKAALGEDAMRQTQLVKIDTENLNKIGEDPLAKFLEIIKKISFIANSQMSFKSNFKKFLVDLFYNKVIMSQDYKASELKNEINSLINLSKEEVEILKIKFEVKKEMKKNITYEMLYFYIQELYDLIKMSK